MGGEKKKEDEWVSKLVDKIQGDPSKLNQVMEELGKLQVNSLAQQQRDHRFWSTQPVPQPGKGDTDVHSNAPIEAPKAPEDIRKKEIPLPAEYEWVQLDLAGKDLVELYELLSNNYVEDVESLFRFDYPDKFLEWALKSPGWKPEWHVGVRHKPTSELMAFVSAIPITVRIADKAIPSVEVNFLCVHKKLRSKRLAPVLIKEVTRRVHLHGIFQALYTAGVVVPTPISSARYYHRSLNPQKLIATGFSHLPRGMTMNKVVKNFSLPSECTTPGLRALTKEDIPQVKRLYDEYMKQFGWVIEYSEGDLEHWIVPLPGVVYSFVVENEERRITDFFSFYILPSQVIGNNGHTQVKAAYSFYYASSSTDLKQLMNDALIQAKKLDCDVYNCLEIMNNSHFITDLKFGPGDGTLYYYMFNWACEPMSANKVGVIML